MEHNPQQWFAVYATAVWVKCTHFPTLWTVRIREKSASVRWVAEHGERVAPFGRGVVLCVVGAGGAPKVHAHWVPRIIAAWRNFQNSVVVAAYSNWGFRAD